MGIVGFIRIVEDAGIINELNIRDNYVEFDSELLNDFHEYYFNYFLKRYDIYNRETKKVNRYLSIAKKEDIFKDAVKWIKGTIDSNRNKVKGKFEDKSYENNFNELFNFISQIKKYDQIEKLEKCVNDFDELMSINEVNEKLTINYVRNILSTQFFGQASFLQKTCARKSVKEQSLIMYKDYLKPILEEATLYEKLNSDTDINRFAKFVEGEIKKDNTEYYSKLLKDIKKEFIKKNKSLDEIKKYIDDKLQHCSVWEQYIATTDFTEAVFVPLAVSNSNARNFMWQGNTSYPICSLLKFILLCTPAGVTDMRNGYFGFVNMDTDISELYRVNENLSLSKDEENPFENLVYDLLEEASKKSLWTLQNILFIEFNADYDSKSCKLNYFNISKNVAKYFKDYSDKDLRNIKNKAFKGNLVNYILINKDIKDLILKKLRECIDSRTNSYDSFLATVARFNLNQILKGSENVDSRKLWVIYNSGQELNKYFKDKEMENKIQGIAYRLLNASKARNKKEFMDSLLRVYMAAGKEVPSLFLNVLHEKDLDFETVAHSFISGLISTNKKEKEEN